MKIGSGGWISRCFIAALSLAAIADDCRAQARRDDCAEPTRCVSPTAMELLGDIAARLPDDTVLQRFTLTKDEAQIQGLSRDVSKLIPLLQRSDVIESPAVQGAVMPDATTRKEMFVISARVRKRPKIDAGTTWLFLPEPDFDAAAAALAQRVSQVVASNGDPNRCQLVQKQYLRSTEPEPFERVTINARIRCDWRDAATILHELETTPPALFVDELTIWKQTGYRAPGAPAAESFLDVHFKVFGYLQRPSSPGAPFGRPSARFAPPPGSRDPFDDARRLD